jgi:vitamin B12 transporter
LGSQNYAQAIAGVSGKAGEGDALSYAIGLQKTRETGISATNSRVSFGFNPDRDGFDQNALNASISYQFTPAWRADAALLYAESSNRLDDGLGRDARSAGLTSVASAGVAGQITPGWKSQFRVSQSVDSSRAVVAAPANLPGLFKTTQNQLTWQNDIDTPLGRVLAGWESLRQNVDSSTAYAVTSRSVNSVFVGINGSAGAHSWQANLRRDANSQFGSASTGFVGYGFALSPEWRISASHGTSFVMPSFNQLYFKSASFNGNPLLQPERGRNTDVSLGWSGSGQSVKLVLFDNRIRGFITGTTLPANVPQARIDGATLAYEGSFGPLSLRASLDTLNPRNVLTGKRLQRRSTERMTLGADYQTGPWTVGGSVLRSGKSFNDAANLQTLGAYTTADVYVDYLLDRDWKLQVKLNNLGNAQYENVLGYNQPGRSVYLTVRYQPK